MEKAFKDLFKSNFAGCTYSRDIEFSQSCMVNGETHPGEDDEEEEDNSNSSPPKAKTLGNDHAYFSRH